MTGKDSVSALECRDITKYYDEALALDAVNLTLHTNEMLGLLGDNGAGKSTLVKILRGVIRPSSGEIRVFGETKSFSSPRDAQHIGIQSVYQEQAIVDALSLAENFFLGQEPTKKWPVPIKLIDHDYMVSESSEYLKKMGFELDVRQELGQFSGGEKQAVEILRALYFKPKVLLLDEPTTALSQRAKDRLFELLTETKRQCPMVLITHDILDAVRLCDRILVLKHGQFVHEMEGRSSSEENAFREIVQHF